MDMKKLTALLLAFCMVLSMLPVTALAATEVARGTCGDNLTWVLTNDGTLTISGTGSMHDYYFGQSPWGDYAEQITLAKIGDGVTSVAGGAFYVCDALTELIIGSGVTELNWMFESCNSLTAFRVDEANRYYSSDEQGVLFDKGKTKLIQAPRQITGSYMVPDGVEEIAEGAFWNCLKLTGVIIPASVKSIGNGAFAWGPETSALEVWFCGNAPEMVTMYNGTFGFTTAIIYYPADNPTWTEDVLLDYGGTITWVSYKVEGGEGGETDQKCGDNVTWTLSNDGTLIISGEGPMWDYTADNAPDWSDAYSVEIRGNVTHIGSYAFTKAESIETVHMQNSQVATIGEYAFFDCGKLYYVKFPKTLVTIGDYTFTNCKNLGVYTHLRLTIPDSVTRIGTGAFQGCTYMASPELGSGLTTIGDDAFADCKTLRVVTLPDSVTTIGTYAFSGCTALTSVGLSENLREIPKGLFYNCSGLEHESIPNSVESIGAYAYANCTSLKSVGIGGGVTTIGPRAFGNCTSLKNMSFHGSAPDTIFGDAFQDVTATVYYYEKDTSWNDETKKDYGGTLTWIPSRSISYVDTERYDNITEQYILIMPIDKNRKFVSGVTVHSYWGDEAIPKEGYEIGRFDAKQENVVLTKNGYQDYILPTVVADTLVGSGGTRYHLSAYMRKNKEEGPYISTVFGRISDVNTAYVDLFVSQLEVLEGQALDFVVTVGGTESRDVIYYIVNEKGAGVPSSNGIFTAANLGGVVKPGAKISVYAVVDGVKTEEMEIKLVCAESSKLLADLQDKKEFAFLGDDFRTIKIDSDVPGLADMEIDLSVLCVPIGVFRDGDHWRIAFGVDSEEGNLALKYNWEDFKLEVNLLSKSMDKAIDAIAAYDRYSETVKTLSKIMDISEDLWMFCKTPKMGIEGAVLGYLDARMVNGTLVPEDGLFTLSGGFKFSYALQGAATGIPIYASAEFSAKMAHTAKFRNLPYPFRYEGSVTAEPEIKVGAGIGINGAISGGIYGHGSLPVTVDYTEEHIEIKLTGDWGLEGQLFLLKGKEVVWQGEGTIYSNHYGDSVCDRVQTTGADAAMTIMSRDYADDTSSWLRSPAQLRNAGVNAASAEPNQGVSFQKLQTSVFSESQPQLVMAGNQLLMAWIQDDTSRDTYNRMRLVYSLYDAASDTWSEPVAVWDDGHNDGYPRMVSDGANVWILWQKINTTMTEETSGGVDTILKNTELCLARFDAQAGTFGDQQMLTSNDLFEYAHSLTLINGIPAVYWATAQDNALSSSGCHTLTGWRGGNTEILAQELNYILSIAAINGEVTYIMDADANLETIGDVTAFTMTEAGTEMFDNSVSGSAIIYAAYGCLDGEQILFLSDMSNVYYRQAGQWKTVFTRNQPALGNLNVVQTDLGTTLVWTESVQDWNELCAVSYQDGVWSEPVRISENGEILSQISAVCYDGVITGICNASAVMYDETSGEYSKGEVDLSLFRISDFTDIALGSSLFIDEAGLVIGSDAEVHVFVYNKGTAAVNRLTVTIADTLGTEIVHTVDVQIPSGSSEMLTLAYPVPENYAATTLTVTVQAGAADVDVSDNTVSAEIGKCDLSITTTAVEYINGCYLLKAIAENQSLVAAPNVTLDVCLDMEDAGAWQSSVLGSISRSEYVLAEIVLDENLLTFDEYGVARVYLSLKADGEDSADFDNTICVLLAKQTEEECAHPAAEPTEVKEPTCSEQGYTTYICSECGDSFVSDYTDPVDHSYDNGCCVWCGAEERFVKWYSGTTSMNGTIDLNIYVVLSADLVNADDTFVRFTYAGKTVDVPMADALHAPKESYNNCYRFTCPIYAKQLADSVNVKFMKGEEVVGKELNYSVETYCKNRIKKSTDPDEVAMCKALLNYGAAAQVVLNYNTDKLANASLSAEDQVIADVDASAYKYSISGSEEGIKAKSATLMFEDVIKVRVYFTLTGDKTIEDYTFTIDGKVATPRWNVKGWYVETNGIAAKDMERMFKVQVGGITVNYGALSYVNSKVTGSSTGEAEKNLAKALFIYWQTAEAYLG